MVSIAGKYEFVSSDNYDEFMKACGKKIKKADEIYGHKF